MSCSDVGKPTSTSLLQEVGSYALATSHLQGTTTNAQALADNAADPEFGRYLASWAWNPYSVDDAGDFIGRRDPSRITWAVEVLQDRACIGTSDLHELDFRNRHCFWGIGIGPPSRWGKGYGTEACALATRFAFLQLGMEKVYLAVHQGNDRGLRAYEKAGKVKKR